jgi:hypothetical protein
VSTIKTTKMIPGDDLYLSCLMAPYGLNFVMGEDRQHLLAYGRAAFAAGQKDAAKPPVPCEPQEATKEGFCEWVTPKPLGYLMQCCDCGLIHEVETRVAKFDPRPSEYFEVIADPDVQAQWRMKRRDDLAKP